MYLEPNENIFKSRYGFDSKDVEGSDTSKYSIKEWLDLISRLLSEKPDISCVAKSADDDNLFFVYRLYGNLNIVIKENGVFIEIKELYAEKSAMLKCKNFIDVCLNHDLSELPLLLYKKLDNMSHVAIKWQIEKGV